MRSLFAGVSGLRNHQLSMDVIGNNIANVNTVGFKVGRTSFSETFAQTLRGSTQPVSNHGGSNPLQVGLGMSVASIDTLFSQGSIQTTGQGTDLAIQGDGFFIVSDGEKRVFTRAGNFQFNSDGVLVMPNNGMKVQGFLANNEGVIEAGTSISDLKLPIDQKIKARATSSVELGGNLDASREPLGTILQTDQLYAIEQAGDDSSVEGLYARGNTNNIISGLIPNSTQVTFTVADPGGTTLVEKSFTYVDADTSTTNGAFHSLDDLVSEILNDSDLGPSVGGISLNANGTLELITQNTGNTLNVSSSNPLLNDAMGGLSGALDGSTYNSDEFSHTARADDTLTSLRNKNGVSLGLQATDIITMNGSVGGNPVATGTLNIAASDTYQDLANFVETTLGLTNDNSVAINPDEGSLKITGDGGEVYELSNLDITATDSGGTTSRTAFNNIFDATPGNYQEIQEAEDVEQSATMTVYDSLGNSFDLTLIFRKDVQQPNRWTWAAKAPEPAAITGGGSGYVEFNPDGSLKNFEFDDGSSTVQISSGDGESNSLGIDLNPGELGGFEGLTQFSGANSDTIITSQDGYGMGILEQINIDQRGQISGAFSNGVVKLLGQLVLANFTNPGGLARSEGNLYTPSGNSGDPILSPAGDGFNTTIVSGALEQSNVDLAAEFTKMIVAQRAFQANARTITISDDMLSEVTNLKR
ncbi:MAG: flagellar hook-basal body complex protein [Aliifodinibius sp.]|nr:flagellar hook-basal body complex protein [Fodinibius sp.]NIW47165.1 flagellar hook-basal body complex protein [Gammaproteobacteria bacterium]NIY28296.1 flagellar hook-basal body complex protein [Fodinibius sp.]